MTADFPLQEVADECWASILTSIVLQLPSELKQHKPVNMGTVQLMKELKKMSQTRRQKNLSNLNLFLALPPELLEEIYSHLHPLDLYHLSRTQKQFRALLVSFQSKWIWQAAFLSNCDIPSCPDDMPHPKWAYLLFGPLECQDCGSFTALHPRWRRRLCGACNQDRAIQLYEAITGLPAQKYKQRNSFQSDGYPSSRSPVISGSQGAWKQHHDEVQRIADRMAFEETILSLTLHANYFDSEHLEVRTQFFGQGVEIQSPDDATKIVIDSLHDSSQTIYDWSVGLNNRCQVQRYQKTVKFLRRSLGHSEGTIRSMLSKFPKNPAVNLIIHRNQDRDVRQEWSKIKPQLQCLVNKSAKLQMAKAGIDAVHKRRRYILESIRKHLNTLDENARNGLPSMNTILLYHPFNDMLNRPLESGLRERDVTEAIISFVDHWPPRTFEDLRVFVPSAHLVPSLTTLAAPLILAGACFVFRCPDESKAGDDSHEECVIGWQATATHLRMCKPGHLDIDERGCAAAIAILQLLKLNLSTTVPSVVDDCGVSFECSICSDDESSFKAMSWRECIRHFIETKANHSTPQWRILKSAHMTDETNKIPSAGMSGPYEEDL